MRYAVDRDEETGAPKRGRGLGRQAAEDDHEITLGTRSLLGIFFGLVLICGIFFGLGYSVGRVSARAIGPTVADSTAPPTTSLTKPSPQEAVNQTPPDTTPAADGTTAVVPTPGAPGTPATATLPGGAMPAAATPPTTPAAPVETATVFPSNPVTTAAAAPVVVPAVQRTVATSPTAGNLMVQVAAVSIPQDADILVAALRQRGYTAVVRHEPSDQLLHIQIGPFASRAQAQAMRARLLSDGYNAVIR
jgi:DedD protein